MKNLLKLLLIVLMPILIINCGNNPGETTDENTTASPWSVAEKKSYGEGDAFQVDMGMDNNGDIVLVWVQSDGTNYQIFKSEYKNGTWLSPASLSDNISPNSTDARSPQVAMDNNGNIIVVWIQSDGSNEQIFKSEYRNGMWSHPASLSDNISPSTTDVKSYSVHLDINDNNEAIVVWIQSDGSKNQVFKSEYRSGSWTNPANLTDNISPDNYNVDALDVALNDTGDAIITWSQTDGVDSKIYKSDYRSSSWSHPSDINDNISVGAFSAYLPQVAISNNGDTVIVWYQNNSSYSQIYKSEYRSGSWSHPSDVSSYISDDNADSTYPQVAMDDNGNTTILWIKGRSGYLDCSLMKKEYKNGSWSDFSELSSSYITNESFNFNLKMSDSGNAIVVWEGVNGFVDSVNQLKVKLYTDTTGWSADSVISEVQYNYSIIGGVAGLSNQGDFAVAWRQGSGTDDRIYFSEFIE